MSIIINTVFFAIIYLEAVASLNAILFSHACAFVQIRSNQLIYVFGSSSIFSVLLIFMKMQIM